MPKLASVYVYPFNSDYVKMEGATSADEFRDWVSKYGDRFHYTLTTAQKGDVIVFAWIENQGEWIMVGDGIVRSNHKTGSERWCDCDKDSEYSRHIITGGIRLYPKNVNSNDFSFKKGQFAKLTPDEYLEILEKSVKHW